jgi:hypothetical protein
MDQVMNDGSKLVGSVVVLDVVVDSYVVVVDMPQYDLFEW